MVWRSLAVLIIVGGALGVLRLVVNLLEGAPAQSVVYQVVLLTPERAGVSARDAAASLAPPAVAGHGYTSMAATATPRPMPAEAAEIRRARRRSSDWA
jgi:hypothetical protein